jgi:hypothetical protein
MLRAPAVPLVAFDTYFSIWSPGDRLTDAATVHWTGRAQPLTSIVRIDDESFRVMGSSTWSQKYNLVWDRVLGLSLFPPAVAAKEMAYHRRIQERYGLALDNRRLYTSSIGSRGRRRSPGRGRTSRRS